MKGTALEALRWISSQILLPFLSEEEYRFLNHVKGQTGPLRDMLVNIKICISERKVKLTLRELRKPQKASADSQKNSSLYLY